MDGHFRGCVGPEGCWCELKRYLLVLAVAACGLAIEIAGALISGSLALAADAVHLVTDNAAIVVSIVVAFLAKTSSHADRVRDRGLYLNATLLALVVFWIVAEAIERLETPREVVGPLMFMAAVLGALANFFQHRILEGAGADHRHQTHRALSLHVISDFYTSLGVIVGSVVILVTGFTLADPTISLGIAAWILWRTVELVRYPTGRPDDHHHH